MAKIEVTWTVEVTETYHEVIDYDDFAAMVNINGGEAPSLEDIKSGEWKPGDLEPDLMADSEVDPDTVIVDGRDVDSVKVIED